MKKVPSTEFKQEPRKSFTPKQRLELFVEKKGICYLCGQKITGDFDVEHIRSLAMGGTNDWNNLDVCHPINSEEFSCHRDKTNKDLELLKKPRRLAKKHTGTYTRKKKKIQSNPIIQSRGFPKTKKKRKIDKSELPY